MGGCGKREQAVQGPGVGRASKERKIWDRHSTATDQDSCLCEAEGS